MSVDLCLGDALDVLWAIPEDSIDSLITDPPAGISFMGKAWDDDKGGRRQWIAWLTEIMCECYRVMKPGAHGLVWALPRTSHWTATALEDAGFDVRDVVTHLFGTGFPKSKNLDGAWSGWGTALKPASEHWILVRKTLSQNTVASNVLTHGTGAINIDGCRIPSDTAIKAGLSDPANRKGVVGTDLGISNADKQKFQQAQRDSLERANSMGRWPANVVLDEQAAELLDDQSGVLSPGHTPASRSKSKFGFGFGDQQELAEEHFGAGGASRFFYVAKPSGKEKNAGLEGKNEHPTVKPVQLMRYLCRMITPPNGTVLDPFMGSGTTGIAATQEGFAFIGIEREQAYLDIAQARIAAAA